MDKYPPIIKKFPHLIHGGDYNPEQWMDQKDVIWPEDMRLAKLAHMNSLSVGIFSWAALEPEEGQYEFGWLDEVMDRLAENGMTAMLATPSGARPAWLSHKYPEVLRVTPERRRRLHGCRHNHCLTSPVYRRKVREINERLAERYKDHPALGLWHVSNEYSGECHCDLCQEAFRQWLRRRYGSLDALNRAWWTAFWSHTFTDWSQIESPTTLGEAELNGLTLDWKRFVSDQTIDFMKAEMEPLRRLTPGVACVTNMMNFHGEIDYAAMARELDAVSWDSYPLWRGDESDVETAIETSMAHDMFRGLKDGRPFLLMESTPSVTNWQPVCKPKRPGALLLGGLQAIAHGSDSVQYFQFRAARGSHEKYHGAVVSHDGSAHTRTFREVAETGAMLEKLDDVVGSAKRSEVAILYDLENRWAIEGFKGMKEERNYVDTIRDHYAPFWKSGISVDIIDSTKDFSGYKLLIAPMLHMLRPGVAGRIEAFVRGGGTFVATYLTGYVDEHDLCFQGGFPGPLKEVLGIWNEEMDPLFDEERREVSFLEEQYLARDFCEVIHLTGAEALAEYDEDYYAGSPAVTVNEYGEGKAYYVAARMDDAFQTDFFGMLADDLMLTRAFDEPLPEGCTAQVRSDGASEYVFVMNFLPYPVEIDVGRGGVSMITGERLSGENELPARTVEVIRRKKS